MPHSADESQATQKAIAINSLVSTKSVQEQEPSTGSPKDSVPKAVARTPDVVPEAVDDRNSIYFNIGATQIDLEGQEKVKAHAARLKHDPDLDVTLIGYTDDLGSRSFNVAISEKRTEAVAKLLLSNGAKKNMPMNHFQFFLPNVMGSTR
ncbi:MAG: OmpA family protein [Betaproteobacteria bacterium]|nr:OmpA family protein [Betaproteobacteria bacterium]